MGRKVKTLQEPAKEDWEREIARIRSWRRFDLHAPPPPDSKDYKWWCAVRDNLIACLDIDRDLMQLGLPVGLADLAQCRLAYPRAVPVLLRHLRRQYPRDVEATIVQALTVPTFRFCASESSPSDTRTLS